LQIDFLFSHYQEATLSETYIDRQFNDIYVTRADIDPAQLRLDPHKVAEAKFVPFGEFLIMLEDKSNPMARVYANECRDLCYFLALPR
jgi:hypothetical protein